MTLRPVEGWQGLGTARITIRKSSGAQRTWDTLGGSRNPTVKDYPGLSDDQIAQKFDRACTYKQMTDEQRDRARAAWSDLRTVRDIGTAMQTLATFGRSRPL
jgi:hypothetical protein